ncbi:hypothetical protein SAMN05421839_11240 [Halolactibacillus halophilus]|uniref:Carbohydrate deacetylase n=1 Tax=Halolactibacillus halophilus TaxID=306540 RepID=A0A1I5P3Q6_9BACI|nr:chitin disaccharide deacetylase [Halolactibacillus halophilus]GEM01524.1 carbohydrate deacetylase [Halolactibacillus halophilus]SFP28126.1 hypothetical protein SAMN05421839_11240 [Halolactibacillus halophilus]
MKVIINADDFGLTEGINKGIIKAHTDGVVTRTTLMMNGTAVDHAVKAAKATPSLKVGIHLVLSYGKPLRDDVDLLINESGAFKTTKFEETLNNEEIKQIEQEWETQIQAFLNTGLTLDHIDSHHHVHGWDCLQPVIKRLQEKHQVPVRLTEHIHNQTDMILTEALWLDFYDKLAQPDLFEKLLELNVDSVEVMTHPAYIDDALLKVSSYTDERERELDLLTSMKVLEGIELC